MHPARSQVHRVGAGCEVSRDRDTTAREYPRATGTCGDRPIRARDEAAKETDDARSRCTVRARRVRGRQMPLCKVCNRRVLCVTVSETGLILFVDAEPSPAGKWSFCGVGKVTSAATTG